MCCGCCVLYECLEKPDTVETGYLFTGCLVPLLLSVVEVVTTTKPLKSDISVMKVFWVFFKIFSLHEVI